MIFLTSFRDKKFILLVKNNTLRQYIGSLSFEIIRYKYTNRRQTKPIAHKSVFCKSLIA
jgi:hypothetical protein